MKLNITSDFDAFYDDFFCNALEANGMAFGGGGTDTEFSGFVELGRRGVQATNRDRLATWLAADSRVDSYQFGETVDAWKVS